MPEPGRLLALPNRISSKTVCAQLVTLHDSAVYPPFL